MNVKLSWDEFIEKYDSFTKELLKNIDNPEFINFISNIDVIIKNSNYSKSQLKEIENKLYSLKEITKNQQRQLSDKKRELTENQQKINQYIINSNLS